MEDPGYKLPQDAIYKHPLVQLADNLLFTIHQNFALSMPVVATLSAYK